MEEKGRPSAAEMAEVLRDISAETQIIRGDGEQIAAVIKDFGNNAASDPVSPFFYGIGDKDSPRITVKMLAGLKQVRERYPRYRIKFITDVQKENVSLVKSMIEAGMEVRHIEGVRANLGVSRTEYLSSANPLENGGLPGELIWSKNPDLVSQMMNVFSKLWESAIPAETRINEVERGILFGTTRLVFDSSEIISVFEESVRNTAKDAYVILSTEDGLRRHADAFRQLAKKAREDSLAIHVLVPPTFLSTSSTLEQMKTDLDLAGIEFRMAERLTPNFNLGIYDQKLLITAQFAGYDLALGSGVLYGTVTTSNETISAMLSIFEALWREGELRDREERSKKKAQLLQDILTHDIRNYNQVARLSAELLREEMHGNVAVEQITRSMLDAIDGSTRLLERAQKLGRVLAEENPELEPVYIGSVIERTFSVVKTANSDREISLETKGVDAAPAVRADELLEEAFSNLFTNSVKYTEESSPVRIRVSVASSSPTMLEISVADEGVGIPDEIKPKLFARYLESAKGSGLGMSIVHALVVERYKGRVSVSDRIDSDREKGTVVKIELPRAP